MSRFPKDCDPRLAHVTFDYAGRHYLGTVRDCYRDDATGTVRLKVHHMNGEPWMDPYYPDRTLDPPMCNVNVLEREYEEGGQS